MCRMLEDFAMDRQIIGAYLMALKLEKSREEATQRTCEQYPITPEELESLVEQWNELVAAGKVSSWKG